MVLTDTGISIYAASALVLESTNIKKQSLGLEQKDCLALDNRPLEGILDSVIGKMIEALGIASKKR